MLDKTKPQKQQIGTINKQYLKTVFIDCMSEANNTQVSNAKDFYIATTLYNLIKYCDNYEKTLGKLY